MSFWTSLASWATKMEEEAVKRRTPSHHRCLSYAEFKNSLHAFEGEIGKMIETAGHIVVQHVSTCMNDMAIVVKNVCDEYAGQMQEWMDTTFKLYDNSISQYFAAHNAAAEQRHKEADERAGKRQNAIMSGLVGMVKSMNATENNQSTRYLELMERIRLSDLNNERKYDVLFNTIIALHENLTEQIQQKQRVVTEYRDEPCLEWMVERADDIIKFADALKALRDNSIPQDAAMMNAVRSVRAMMPVSIHDIQDILNARTHEWQMAA